MPFPTASPSPSPGATPTPAPTPSPTPSPSPTRTVLVWSEGTAPKSVYPDDINAAVAQGLTAMLPAHWRVRTADIDDAGQGIRPEDLADADVLVWWAHLRHTEIADEAAERIAARVREQGMGFVPIHSGSWGAKPYMRLTLHGGAWNGGSEVVGESNRILVAAPEHPVANGVTDFTIPEEERYLGTMQAPPPDAVVFDGVYEKDGLRGAQGLAWTLGAGRMFYLRPGHETFPVYFQPEVRRILRNAVLWTGRDEASIGLN